MIFQGFIFYDIIFITLRLFYSYLTFIYVTLLKTILLFDFNNPTFFEIHIGLVGLNNKQTIATYMSTSLP